MNTNQEDLIDRISTIAAKYVGKPVVNYPLVSPPLDVGGELYRPGDLLRSLGGLSEAEKLMIIELAVAAMEELIRITQMAEPLWMLSNADDTSFVLTEEEYNRAFPRGIGSKPSGFKVESSKETYVVIMNHINLIEILMDVNQWSTVFLGYCFKSYDT